MKKNRLKFGKFVLAAAGLLTLAQAAKCQVFDPNGNGYDELFLGLRKVGSHQANYEVVVDIGAGTNYAELTPGNSMTVPGFSSAQLVTSAFADYTYLNWSVLGGTDSSILSYCPVNTLWITVPRANTNTQSTAPQRLTRSQQQTTADNISSIWYGAELLSQNTSSNALYNTATLLREPINDTSDLSSSISDAASPTNSTLQGSWTQNVENITPSPFTGTSVSDLYEVRPSTTNGPATYLGYFTLNTNGTMTFTRATAYVAPAAPRLSLVRKGTTNMIMFGTANSATYTLHYTNAAGLGVATHNWPAVTTNITGNGLTNAFKDVTTDTNRFYRVIAH